jgi:hypothetical protein
MGLSLKLMDDTVELFSFLLGDDTVEYVLMVLLLLSMRVESLSCCSSSFLSSVALLLVVVVGISMRLDLSKVPCFTADRM